MALGELPGARGPLGSLKLQLNSADLSHRARTERRTEDCYTVDCVRDSPTEVPSDLSNFPDDTVQQPEGPVSDLVRSRQRVADHGEVLTPAWLVEDMLNLVGAESERVDARFMEPACGSGNFLVPVLRRKLATVHMEYASSDFEKEQHALLSLMCIYGIELLADNAVECRTNLLDTLFGYLGNSMGDEWFRAAQVVVEVNIIEGDALAMTTPNGESITFPEWGYLGKGKFQRRDFQYAALTGRSAIAGTLFEMLDEQDIFRPTKTYAPMTVVEIGR